MTATTTTPWTPVRPDRTGVTFGRVVRSEWIKLRSLRSTVWTLALTVLVAGGMAAISAWSLRMLLDDGLAEQFGVANGALAVSGNYLFVQLPLIVLGVLAITGEYSTGQIRSTLAAVPRRVPALLAKALVLGLVALVTSVVAVALSWALTLPFFSGTSLEIDLGSAEAQRLLVGNVLYLVAITLFALGAGALLRHSAAAITATIALLVVVEQVLGNIPVELARDISVFLPGLAGSRVLMDDATLESIRESTTSPYLEPWLSFGVLGLWVVLLLGLAAVLLRRRDA